MPPEQCPDAHEEKHSLRVCVLCGGAIVASLVMGTFLAGVFTAVT